MTTHGKSGAPEYLMWLSMKARCKWSPFYVDRIIVCERWSNSFVDYWADILSEIGPQPSSSHTIDRTDNDGNYEPGNVRWATQSEQIHNQRPRKGTLSRGVHLSGDGHAYEAGITVEGKPYYLGRFKTLEEAIIARKEAESKYRNRP